MRPTIHTSFNKYRMLLCAAVGIGLASHLVAAANTEKISYHEVKTDGQGKLMPWYGSGPSQAYDHVIRLVWNFWRDMKPCPNGIAYYLQGRSSRSRRRSDLDGALLMGSPL
jgi:hypothetical protein